MRKSEQNSGPHIEIPSSAVFRSKWIEWRIASGFANEKDFYNLFYKGHPSITSPKSYGESFKRIFKQPNGDLKEIEPENIKSILVCLYDSEKYKETFPGGPLELAEFSADPNVVREQRRVREYKRQLGQSVKELESRPLDYSFGISREGFDSYFKSLSEAHMFACSQQDAVLTMNFSAALVHGYELVGQWNDAAWNCRQWVSEARRLGDEMVEAEALFRWGRACYRTGAFGDSVELIEQCLALINKRNTSFLVRLKAEAEDYRAMALFRGDGTKANQAKILLAENEANWKKIDIPLMHAWWKHRMGVIELALGDLASAKNYVLEALESAMKHCTLNFLARNLMQLSRIHREQKELKQGHHISHLAWCFVGPTRHHLGQAEYFYEMGILNCLLEAERPDKVLEKFGNRLILSFDDEKQYPDSKERELLKKLTDCWHSKVRSHSLNLDVTSESAEYWFKECIALSHTQGFNALAQKATLELKKLIEAREYRKLY